MEEIKVAFLDRDGTIVKEYDDNGWINRTEPEFLSNSIEGLKAISHLGYKIIIITNQGLINKGYISWDNYNMFTSNMLRILLENGIEIFDIFCCPHRKKENCDCMKPKPGMILQACKKYNINLSQSFFAGDTTNDEGIAKYFDLDFYAIRYSPVSKYGVRVDDLLEIANILLRKENKQIKYFKKKRDNKY